MSELGSFLWACFFTTAIVCVCLFMIAITAYGIAGIYGEIRRCLKRY